MISGQESLWTESMLWDKQVTVSSGIGYRDNIFLSPFAPRASAFFVNGLDLTVLRMPLDGWKIVGLITGEEMHDRRNLGTNSEDPLYRPACAWSGSCLMAGRRRWNGRASLEKQVLDVTTSRAAPVTALVEGYGLSGRPFRAQRLPEWVVVQVELPFRRLVSAKPVG